MHFLTHISGPAFLPVGPRLACHLFERDPPRPPSPRRVTKKMPRHLHYLTAGRRPGSSDPTRCIPDLVWEMTLKDLTPFNDAGRLSILASPPCAPTFPRCNVYPGQLSFVPIRFVSRRIGRIGLRGIRGWRRQLKTAGNQRSNILTSPRGESFGSVSIKRHLPIRISRVSQTFMKTKAQYPFDLCPWNVALKFIAKFPLARLFLPSRKIMQIGEKIRFYITELYPGYVED